MSKSQVITAAYLEGIKYNDLQAVLKEYGIGKAFKGGERKADIIKRAIDLLAKINEPKADETKDSSPEEGFEAVHSSEVIIQKEIKDDLDEQEYEVEVKIQAEIESDLAEQELDYQVATQDQIEMEIEELESESDEVQEVAQMDLKEEAKQIAIDARAMQDAEDDKLRKVIKKLSPEEIQKNLKNIEANLTNNIEGQKPILLKKRQILLEFVEE